GAAGVLVALGFVPGMPVFVLWTIAAGIFVIGRRTEDKKAAESETAEEEKRGPDHEPTVEELLEVDTLRLEIGFGLVSLVDEGSGGHLIERLGKMRRQFASEFGIVVPPIHIRDNLGIPQGQYQLMLREVAIGSGDLLPNKLLAIDPGSVMHPVDGVKTKDPTFGLDALWIPEDARYAAEASGYTVVDLETVVTTHVGELVRQNAAELLGWQELQLRLESVKQVVPKLVDDLGSNGVSHADLLRMLRQLLRERVSIRDLRTILETVASHAGSDASVDAMVGHIRARLASQISASFAGRERVIHAVLLDSQMEDQLRRCLLVQGKEPVLACDLATAQHLFAQIEEAMGAFAAADAEPVILAPPDLRGPLSAFLAQFFPNIHVICHREVASRVQVRSIGQIGTGSGARALPDAA
ncbi:MAG: FHIPEP family type III secretion protein, partial [Myxococcales bacterium]|nr:FHIPEP family type III secretion protein [Myxococcales bacterium]